MPYSLRIPDVLQARIDKAANGKKAEWILEACRMRLDGDAGAVEAVRSHEPDGVGSTPTPATKPDMAALREICAGDLTATLNDPWCGDVPPPTATEIPVCGKTWWEDGEHYECLMEKGHREQKHGLRGMSRTLEP